MSSGALVAGSRGEGPPIPSEGQSSSHWKRLCGEV